MVVTAERRLSEIEDALSSEPTDVARSREKRTSRASLVALAGFSLLAVALLVLAGWVHFKEDPRIYVAGGSVELFASDIALVVQEQDRPRRAGGFYTGPGGYLDVAGRNVVFSADGRQWRTVTLPRGPDDPRPARFSITDDLDSTTDTWLMFKRRDGSARLWTSSDGISWTPMPKDPLHAKFVGITSIENAFIGIVRADDGQSRDRLFHSVDGSKWEQWQVPDTDLGSQSWEFVMNPGHVVYWNVRQGPFIELMRTFDGRRWERGLVDAIHDGGYPMAPIALASVGDTAILFAFSREGDSRLVHVWTSGNFTSWEYQGPAPFKGRHPELRVNPVILLEGETTFIAVQDPGQPHRSPDAEYNVWATSDGESWEMLASLTHHDFEIKQGPDGTFVLAVSE